MVLNLKEDLIYFIYVVLNNFRKEQLVGEDVTAPPPIPVPTQKLFFFKLTSRGLEIIGVLY